MLSPQRSQTFRRQDAVSSGAEEPHAGPAADRTVGEYEKVFAWRLLPSLSGAGCSCSVYVTHSSLSPPQLSRAVAPALATQSHRYASGKEGGGLSGYGTAVSKVSPFIAILPPFCLSPRARAALITQ